MMSAIVERVYQKTSARLSEIKESFIPEAKATLIIRIPDNDDADFIITDDHIDGVIEALKRHKDT